MLLSLKNPLLFPSSTAFPNLTVAPPQSSNRGSVERASPTFSLIFIWGRSVTRLAITLETTVLCSKNRLGSLKPSPDKKASPCRPIKPHAPNVEGDSTPFASSFENGPPGVTETAIHQNLVPLEPWRLLATPRAILFSRECGPIALLGASAG